MTSEHNFVSTQQWSLKHVAYHEAAHAVIMWNFGFDILRVVVNRTPRSGYVLPFGVPATGQETIGNILALLAGGLAHRCYASGLGKQEVRCSVEDCRQARQHIYKMSDLTPGAEIIVMGYFMNRTRELIDTPEIKIQIQAIAKAVLPKGIVTKWQFQKTLNALPASMRAKEQCRAMKLRIESEWKEVVEKAITDAPRIAAMQEYQELLVLINY